MSLLERLDKKTLVAAIEEMRGALEEVAKPINGEDVGSLTQLAVIVGLKQREAKIALTKVSKMLEE